MKLRRVLKKTGPAVEALKPDTVDEWIGLDNIASDDLTHNILSVLQLGPDGWQRLTDKLLLCEVEEAANACPVILPFEPTSFRDFLLFEQHFIDASKGYTKRFLPKKYKIASYYERLMRKPFPRFMPPEVWYKVPLYYFGNHLNFITSDEVIQKPAYTEALDYELELGAVLSKPLLNATADEAMDAIGGYVVLNDLSARDVQFPEMKSGFGPQKSKHFQNAMSPIVVTADEINPDMNHLDASVVLNGLKTIPCSTRGMQYSMGEAIAYAARSEQLHPGELFGSGTLPGGCGMENGCWIESGMVLTLQINKIGELTNPVV